MSTLENRVDRLERLAGGPEAPPEFWLDEGTTVYRPRDGERLRRAQFGDRYPDAFRFTLDLGRAGEQPSDGGGVDQEGQP